MIKAYPCEIVFRPVGAVFVKVSNLAVLFCQVAVKVKTQSAAPGALSEDGRFHVWQGLFSGCLLLFQRVL